MNELKLNIIPFDHLAKEITFGFQLEKSKSNFPLNKAEFPQELEEYFTSSGKQEIERVYGEPLDAERDYEFTLAIQPKEQLDFIKHYYTFLIYDYFAKSANIATKNFIGDTEAWFLSKGLSTKQYWAFKKYTVKVQFSRVTEFPELLISYDGISSILKTPVSRMNDVPPEYITTVAFKGKLYNYQEPFPWLKQYIDKLYPKLNNPLKLHYGISFNIGKSLNPQEAQARRYKDYWADINWFLENHITTDSFKAIIPLASDDFISYPDDMILGTSNESNELLFGKDAMDNHQSGTVPKIEFGRKGPYQPTLIPNVRLLFIYHKQEKDNEVAKLYKALTKGISAGKYSLKRMSEFIKQNLYFPESKGIELSEDEDYILTVRKHIKALDTTTYRYLALYVAPQSKESLASFKPEFYYQLKEELLYSSISSQVILKDTINDPKNFLWSMNNIGIAMLAKIGGIPWRLNRMINDELIVGIGAFVSETRKAKYVGNAFCFNNEGVFQDFTCYRSDDLEALAVSIRKAIFKYKIDYGDNAKRLVIHFYKKMSDKELEPFVKTLNDFQWMIPIVIITINKTDSNDYVGFDVSTDHLMPLSGTILPIGKNQYLLFNNAWYNRNYKPDGFHFPVKLTFSSTKPEILEEKDTIQELIDQVYQFSRMYWKSNKQQNLPVTIKYPEMAAELYSHFEHPTLPEFGQKNLWFL